MHGCLRCLKILYFHNCLNLFFVPERLWNWNNQKLLNFRKVFFYRSVISPFAVKLFLLPLSSHCSTHNIGFIDCGYFTNPPQPSSSVYGALPLTGHPRSPSTKTTVKYMLTFVVPCKMQSQGCQMLDRKYGKC